MSADSRLTGRVARHRRRPAPNPGAAPWRPCAGLSESWPAASRSTVKFHGSASRRRRSPSSSCTQSRPGGSGPGTYGSRAGGGRRAASCSSRSRPDIPRKPTTSCMRNRRCRRGVVYPHDQLGQRGPDSTHRGSHRRELGQCVQVADRGWSATVSAGASSAGRWRIDPARPGSGCLPCLREGDEPAAVALAGYWARRCLRAMFQRACRRLRSCAARPTPGLGRPGQGAARTVMKSRLQPTRYWSAGWSCPGMAACRRRPGARA